MTDTYKTLRQNSEAEYVEKRSRFISRLWTVATEAEAKALLGEMRTKHWDASHNVYAWVIREEDMVEAPASGVRMLARHSDDGEPQGTAGLPVLDVLRRGEICNALCVVTRYFGGVLLGASGLTRAYAHAAKLALNEAGVLLWQRWAEARLVCDYARYERLRAAALQGGALVEREDFLQDVTLTLAIPAEEWDGLQALLTDVSAGEAALQRLGERHRGIQPG